MKLPQILPSSITLPISSACEHRKILTKLPLMITKVIDAENTIKLQP